MLTRRAIFADHDAFEERLLTDMDAIARKVEALRALDQRIVLTSGSFDLPHIGHMRYLREARALGDVLIVGIDSDDKVRSRKGSDRPIMPERERAEMIAHSRYADLLVIKPESKERHLLIKTVRPDILVISDRTGYDETVCAELRKYCGGIQLLESQAQTSTSANVRKLQLETLAPCLKVIREAIDKVEHELRGGGS